MGWKSVVLVVIVVVVFVALLIILKIKDIFSARRRLWLVDFDLANENFARY